MSNWLHIEGFPVEITFKKIKNIHLKVHAPEGRVSLSVPLGMAVGDIRSFALSRLDWIRKNREKICARPVEAAWRYTDGELHFLWGIPHHLKLCEIPEKPSVTLQGREICLSVRPGTDAEGRKALLQSWYRRQLREASLPLIGKWEEKMGVRVERLFVRSMKSRWGSCNFRAGSIRLNTDLARRPLSCLEYVIVHELVHLLEPSHNARFKALMDRFLPLWPSRKALLNQPLRVREEKDSPEEGNPGVKEDFFLFIP